MEKSLMRGICGILTGNADIIRDGITDYISKQNS
jgi:hypothetical protein